MASVRRSHVGATPAPGLPALRPAGGHPGGLRVLCAPVPTQGLLLCPGCASPALSGGCSAPCLTPRPVSFRQMQPPAASQKPTELGSGLGPSGPAMAGTETPAGQCAAASSAGLRCNPLSFFFKGVHSKSVECMGTGWSLWRSPSCGKG